MPDISAIPERPLAPDLAPADSTSISALATAAFTDDGEPDIRRVLDSHCDWAGEFPWPGEGDTLGLWARMAQVAALDVSVARAIEPHLDALAILRQAAQDGQWSGIAPDGATWGVFAAEGASPRLAATKTSEGWRLTGVKPWCSLASDLSHALITAWTGDDTRALFAVDLRGPGVRTGDGSQWVARGLPNIPSEAVTFTDVQTELVAESDWYTSRSGFWWGGIGVAACWFGGMCGVAERLVCPAPKRPRDQVAWAHLGAVDTQLHIARVALRDAAAQIDAGAADGAAAQVLALRVRSIVRQTADRVLATVAQATGPGPLATEEQHARRVAGLELYIRQEHGPRDQVALAQLTVAEPTR
ncbi:acyl-CoA/acyl-ACP dehydrogenase [Rudaeicoccus suwonensis]|uniref:Alkylation response protein AidB-like acyl-CoA dehydrogenase n=1 Tax=Rudaeicoccus suwonensis TaxID=657409 RepID=A0A561E3P7_9MICO|nr:acyl-CoA/acyl-ACP dehydrogenase [Rudaeicoccus suwonensis]TWE10211.1 alkylation response protein AidB-like acyl-CoA dehydrogenase [Rudaeicoccus suwonensis]